MSDPLGGGLRAAVVPALAVDEVTACDLFAGAGGFSLGALFASVHVVAAIESDRRAASTYHANLVETGLSHAKLFENDIVEFAPSDLIAQSAFKNRACDIMLGGPPCQGFSTHRFKNAGVDDPRNALLLRYFEYVSALRPLFFLVENVPGLLWPRHKSFIDAFYALANSAGYRVVEPVILNAKDYGVPQSRRRVFLLGYDRHRLRAAPLWPPAPSHGKPDNEDGLPAWLEAAVAFGPVMADDPNDIHMNHSQDLVKAFQNTPLNGGRVRTPVASYSAIRSTSGIMMCTVASIRSIPRPQ